MTPMYRPTEPWTVPPQNQGQIVTISYSLDAPAEVILERVYDASDQTTIVTAYRYPTDDDGEWDPWNCTPRLGEEIGRCEIEDNYEDDYGR